MKRLLDPNSQKTHYVLDTESRRLKAQKRELETQTKTKRSSPFYKLPNETNVHVHHRYLTYQKIWAHQAQAIHSILNLANNDLFASLLQYVRDPIGRKLSVVYLGLSSNTANNLRVFEEFAAYVHAQGDGANVRMVRLNSRVCFNIKTAIREVVKQVVQGYTEKPEKIKDEDEDDNKEGDKVKDEENDLDVEDDAQELDKEDEIDVADSDRISYDFGIVEDWAREYMRQMRAADKFRIVVVLEDSDGFSNEVLNQLVQLLCVYSTKTPIKLVMGLSFKKVSGWINANLASKLRTLVSGCKLVAKENKDVGFLVINEILLQNKITAENPLLLDAQLSLIILSRFENSNNSIDSLITELKFAYLTYFYQLPLSALVDPSFQPTSLHFDALRKLPSFKTHMEYLLNTYKASGSEALKKEETKQLIQSLLGSDERLHSLFLEARDKMQQYQNAVMNAANIIHFLGKGEKHRFQIYKLVTNNQLINSVFLSDVLKRLQQADSDQIAETVNFINSEVIKTNVDGILDEDVISLQTAISAYPENVVEHVTKYLHENKHLNMKISDNLFNEVLTINGGSSELDALRPPVTLEENYENLMIHVIRPKHRELLELGLDEPQIYLRNAVVVDKANKKGTEKITGPPLCKLYQVYKDAPVNINIWDFYVAFKLSLSKGDIIKELKKNVENATSEEQNTDMLKLVEQAQTEEGWDKLVYSWFVQSSYELLSMGFLREKSKGDYVEKMIWKSL